MSAAAIVAALLNDPLIVAAVGGRIARRRLPQGSALPGLVYTLPNSIPVPRMNLISGPQLERTRIQVVGLAMTSDGVDQVLDLVKSTLAMKSGTYAGALVAGVESDIRLDVDQDPSDGVWYGPQDFIMLWYS